MKLIAFAGVPGAGKDTAGRYLQQHFPNVYVEKFATPLQDIVALMSGDYDSRLTHRQLFEDQKWKNTLSIDTLPFLQDHGSRHWLLNRAVKVICGEPTESDTPLNKLSVQLVSSYKSSTSSNWSFTGNYIYQVLNSEFSSVFNGIKTGLPVRDFWCTPREAMQLFGTELCRCYIHKNVWVSCMMQTLQKYKDTDTTVVITDLRFKNEYEMLDSLGGYLLYIYNPVAVSRASDTGLLSHQSEQQQDFLSENADWYVENTGENLSVFLNSVKNVYEVLV